MTAPLGLLVGLLAAAPYDVPIDLGRDEARDLAQHELADPAYHVDDPSLFDRAANWVLERIQNAVEVAAGLVPGGLWGLLVALLVGAVVVAVVVWRAGGVRRSAATPASLFVGQALPASEHRRRAERAASSGRWEEAVLERYRAVVRSLEERTILDPRPGRTADEAAAEAGLALPTLARDLAAAAATFDAVVYGGRAASSTDDRFMRELDRSVGETRPRALAAGPRL